MISSKLAISLVLLLSLAPAVAAGERLLEPESAAAPTGSPPSAVCASPANLLAPQAPILLAAGSCTATADCWDGSQVTCSARGSSAQCSFTDSDCPSIRGSCSSTDEGTKNCPACPCSTPLCSDFENKPCGKPGSYSPACHLVEGGNCNFHCFCSSTGIYICP